MRAPSRLASASPAQEIQADTLEPESGRDALWCADCDVWLPADDQAHGAHNVLAPVQSRRREGLGARSVPIEDVHEAWSVHLSGFPWMDRSLGGGIVSNGVYFLSGDSGAGKTTLMSKLAANLACQGIRVLQVSGEETRGQIKHRALRLNAVISGIRLMTATRFPELVEEIEALIGGPDDPDVIIVDSVQAIAATDDGAAGTIAQVRELAHRLVAIAKNDQDPRALFGVVQITKEGTIAGPQALVHAGDAHYHLHRTQGGDRVWTQFKDRFSGNPERIVLEMAEGGLVEIPDPVAAMLREILGAPGAVACPALLDEGRVVLVPIEASVSEPAGAEDEVAPTAGIGVPTARVKLLADLLRTHTGIALDRRTVRVEVHRVMGVAVDEPALDLAIAAAILSAYLKVPPPPGLAIWGKVGLSGQVQSCPRTEARREAAAKLGLARLLGPRGATGAGVSGLAHLAHLPRWFQGRKA